MDNYVLRLKRIIGNSTNLICTDGNIFGVGLGNKIINGNMTSTPTLTFFVRKKLSKGSLHSSNFIPTSICNIKTDVLEVRDFNLLSDYNKSKNKININKESLYSKQDFYNDRPAYGGMNIGPSNRKVMGTIGYAVTDVKTKEKLYILTANHLLTIDGIGKPGTFVLQPSLPYGGKEPKDVLGIFYKTIEVKRGIPQNPKDINEIDAALVLVGYNTKEVKDTILCPKIASPYPSDGSVVLKGITEVKPGDIVSKMGAITAKTTGKVITIHSNVAYEEEEGKITAFRNQTLVKLHSMKGDSGSIGYTEKDEKAFGLLMGGNGSLTFFNDIFRVFNLLNIELAY